MSLASAQWCPGGNFDRVNGPWLKGFDPVQQRRHNAQVRHGLAAPPYQRRKRPKLVRCPACGRRLHPAAVYHDFLGQEFEGWRIPRHKVRA